MGGLFPFIVKLGGLIVSIMVTGIVTIVVVSSLFIQIVMKFFR